MDSKGTIGESLEHQQKKFSLSLYRENEHVKEHMIDEPLKFAYYSSQSTDNYLYTGTNGDVFWFTKIESSS